MWMKIAIAIAIAILGIAKLQLFNNDYSVYDKRTYKVNA
jgi:hypothetical protein